MVIHSECSETFNFKQNMSRGQIRYQFRSNLSRLNIIHNVEEMSRRASRRKEPLDDKWAEMMKRSISKWHLNAFLQFGEKEVNGYRRQTLIITFKSRLRLVICLRRCFCYLHNVDSLKWFRGQWSQVLFSEVINIQINVYEVH